MATKKRLTLRAQWLGQQIRELRTAAGMTLEEAGEYLQRNAGTVSRFESAEYPIRRGDLLALLDLYGVAPGTRRQELLRLAEDVWQKGWWDGYAGAVDQQLIDLPWLESRATRICTFDPLIVEGLAQTREYAEALIRNAAGADVTDEQITRWVELRMQRQHVMHDDDPTTVCIVMEDNALHRPVGKPEVLIDQLAHLIELARRRTVDIRIVPREHGLHAGLDGGFRLLELPDPYPDVAYVESLAGKVFVESPGTERFRRAYDRLTKEALGPQQSVRLISAVLRGLQ